LKLAGLALVIAVTAATGASSTAPFGWTLRSDGTYVHEATQMTCPPTWAWVKRVSVSSPTSGSLVGRCTYVGGETAEVRIRHFDPTSVRDQETLEKERQLMNQPGASSRVPFGYFIRSQEPVIGGKPIEVWRYTMKHAGMLIDCETKYGGINRGDVTLNFDGLCRSLQER
jgi:hypothetical protein